MASLRILFTLMITLLCVQPLLAKSTNASSPQLSYKAFGHLPMVSKATISPDGKHVAMLLNSGDEPSVVVSEFGKTELTTVVKLKKSQDRIDSIFWANNERLIISASYSKKMLGDRIRVNRLFAINRDGSDYLILKRRNTKNQSKWMDLLSSSRIVAMLYGDDKHVLIQLYDERDKARSVFKVNIYDNEFDKLFVNSYDVDNWFANQDGNVVFGVGREKDTTTIWYRENVKTDWKKLHTRKAYEGSTFNPIMVKNGKAFVISDNNEDKQSIWLYDIATNKFEKKLYGNAKYDVKAGIVSPDGREVIGAVYFDHYRKNAYFNDDDAKIYRIVRKSFKQYHASIVDFSLNRKQILVLAQRDDTPPKYFWLDLQKRGGGFLYSMYPYLEGKKLPHVRPFEFKTSSGMTLNGYLTLPLNVKGKPPLVVFPHGGPQARDYQYFNPYVQYMANQGYAVLQVNYRGSTGFGNRYETKGYRQWGEAMQKDIYESVDWLAKQNLVDMNNKCFVGASYGGFAALTASFQKADDYKCFVSIAGIADLVALTDDEYKYPTMRAFIKQTVGDPKDDDDVAKMKKVSAIHHLSAIKSPLLLIHGVYDTQVNVSQSQDFVAQAKRAGVSVEYHEYPYGTHYLDENNNRLAAFETLGKFLNSHLH